MLSKRIRSHLVEIHIVQHLGIRIVDASLTLEVIPVSASFEDRLERAERNLDACILD